MNKADINPTVFELYNDYAHNRISKEDFTDRLSAYATNGWTVPALISYLTPDYIAAIQVKADDPRIVSSYITYPSPKGGGTIKALLCIPAGNTGKLPGIIVVHENRGLNPHIEDVARRAALEGFISLAPDALSPLGGYPGNDDDGRALHSKRDPKEMLEDFIAGFTYLQHHANCNGKIGVVGFCFGGWISNMMAARIPELLAAAPFYGMQAPLEEVPAIQAALQLHYAASDASINAGIAAYEKALQDNDKDFVVYHYPNTHHGFHNDTTPRYDKDAAVLAWTRTITFFKKKLQ
ncbi:carboxymethylenebutenolidase [Chitinophaga dinghuensis]|uniref:Carboxymethylenebutenolidase n=1 Tax=Chitinophaga dinghuensis TaxID=1539050 RepID=A0A327W4A4_9BACT|nr:dienelactone hydrolase family protein [Chitinophaga dinghuensis]RAJ83200.1 carboxymethylenebutenolidase [Chitinophaga dinghuensis]